MLAYEYSDASPLVAADRPYAANADKTPYGGANYDSYFSDPGNILNPATQLPMYGVPAAQSGQGLAAATLSPNIRLENQFAQAQLFPEVRSHDVYATVAQDINPRLQLFFEGRFADAMHCAAIFPTPRPCTSRPPILSTSTRSGTEATQRLHTASRATTGPGLFRQDPGLYRHRGGNAADREYLAGNTQRRLRPPIPAERSIRGPRPGAPDGQPGRPGSRDCFQSVRRYRSETLAAVSRDFPLHMTSSIESTRLVVDGSLFRLPAGDAKLAVGVERREEDLSHDVAIH